MRLQSSCEDLAPDGIGWWCKHCTYRSLYGPMRHLQHAVDCPTLSDDENAKE